jgi:hypothetical protein
MNLCHDFTRKNEVEDHSNVFFVKSSLASLVFGMSPMGEVSNYCVANCINSHEAETLKLHDIVSLQFFTFLFCDSFGH